jgi:hypothetical protein
MSTPPTKQNTNTGTELSKEFPFSLQDFLKFNAALQQKMESIEEKLVEVQNTIAAVTPENKLVTNNCNLEDISALTLTSGIASAPATSQDNGKSSEGNDGTRAPSTSNLNGDFGIAATAKKAASNEAASKKAASNEAASNEAASKKAASNEAASNEAASKEAGSGGSVNKENISISGETITPANAADVATACKQKIALLEKAREKAVDRLKEAEQAIIAEKPVIRYARSNKKMIAIGVISGLTNKWCYQPDLPEWCEGLREGKFIISISVYYDMLYIATLQS